MSFSVNKTGTKAGVTAAVKKCEMYNHEPEREIILASIKRVPGGHGVKVDASGHTDANQHNFSLKVETLFSHSFHVDPKEDSDNEAEAV